MPLSADVLWSSVANAIATDNVDVSVVCVPLYYRIVLLYIKLVHCPRPDSYETTIVINAIHFVIFVCAKLLAIRLSQDLKLARCFRLSITESCTCCGIFIFRLCCLNHLTCMHILFPRSLCRTGVCSVRKLLVRTVRPVNDYGCSCDLCGTPNPDKVRQ